MPKVQEVEGVLFCIRSMRSVLGGKRASINCDRTRSSTTQLLPPPPWPPPPLMHSSSSMIHLRLKHKYLPHARTRRQRMDVDRAQVLEQYRAKVREHREVELRCVVSYTNLI